MNTLTLHKDNKNYFLSYEGTFSDDYTQILPIEVELVSNSPTINFFRIKIYNNYLTCVKGEICFISEKNDSNLLYKMNLNNRIFFLQENRYIVDKNFKLDTEEELNIRSFNQIPAEIKFGYRSCTKVQELFINGIVTLDFNLETLLKDDFNKAREIVNTSSHKRMELLELDVCFQKLLSYIEIKKFIKNVFKVDFHLTTFSSNRVNKNFSQPGWHVDYPYHNITTPYPVETLGLQLLILLDDFRTDNGGTEYIIGSHVYRKFPSSKDIDMNLNKHRQLVAKKGSVVLWLGKLWHQEGVSQVEEYRSALLANFSPLHVPAKNDVKNQFKYKSEGYSC
jgi:hypothetical protein